MLEILYLSVALVTVYQSQLLLRRAGAGQRAYAMLLLLDGAVAGIAFAGGRFAGGGQLYEVLGAASIFGFFGLVVVPPLLRELTRLALARERLGLALVFARLRELLSPGMGGRQERELIEVVRAVRRGDVDGALASLRAQREASGDLRERAALEDRIVFTLLSAARWREATDTYERGRAIGAPASVPLAVEMVRAYGELGDLERAVEIVSFLESVPGADEPALASFVARARMLFLAYAGRPAAVASAFGSVGLPPAARAYWLGTARFFAGDAEGARAELSRAAALSRRDARGRVLAEERLAAEVPPPPVLPPAIAAYADRAEEAAVGAGQVVMPERGGTPATVVLIVANLVAFALVTWLLGSSEDGWVLARAGANLKSAAGTEPWRLLTSAFLHVGALHLALNMMALWSVGRLVERMLGWASFTAVYLLAGIGGSAASVLFGGPGLSAGASGAIFGVVGAAIAELALLRRGIERGKGWRRLVLGNLVFVVIVQLAIGFTFPMIDQSAHVGGLLCGALATLLLSPAGALGRARVGTLAVKVLAIAGVAAVLVSAGLAATTSYGKTLERGGWQRRELAGVSLEVPRLWVVVAEDSLIADPTDLVRWVQVKRITRAHVGAVPYAVRQDLEKEGMSEIDEVRPSLPPIEGWRIDELRFVERPGQIFHMILFTRPDGEAATFLSVLVPRRHLEQAVPLLERLVTSVR